MPKVGDNFAPNLEARMSAAAEARAMICAVERGHAFTKAAWFQSVARLFGMSPRHRRR